MKVGQVHVLVRHHSEGRGVVALIEALVEEVVALAEDVLETDALVGVEDVHQLQKFFTELGAQYLVCA